MLNKYIKPAIGFLFTILACIYAETIQAQTYPVQANVYIMPPYGKHLNDYYTTSKEKLVVSLLNRDQQKPVLEVRLRMSITASNGLKLQSKEEVNYPVITLDANIPTRLTQDDLAPYFRHINTQGYLDQGKLPDGMVEFTFQVIEKYTGKVLSAPATGRVWLSTQKPPLLRLPSQDDAIGFRDPVNLKFQWEPQHKNLSQVEYEFELRELPDNGAAPQSAFMYAPVIHQQRSLYTYLIYDVMMPPLDPDKRYGWRVRAIAKDGVDELNMFENNGYSEIFWFRTQGNCLPPTALSVNLQNRRLDLKWLPEIGNNEFVIQYRPKYGTSETWQEVNTYDAQTSIYDMQRGTVYEYRVGAICTTGQPVFTNTGEITIPAVDSTRLANCGVPPQLDLENKERLPELKVGDRVMLSDYPMTVTKVSGANGNFNGEGWVPVNWLLETKWAVEFSNITVNTDYKMIAGSVRAKYDETEGNIANIDHITEGGSDNTRNGIIRPDITLDFSIPENPNFSYNEEKGELVVYDTSGNQQHVELPKNSEGKVVFPVTVIDKGGNIHKVDVPRDENGNPLTDENGNPVKDKDGNQILESTYLGKQGSPLADNSFDRKNISADVAVVTFAKGASVYAFDTWLDIYKEISKIGQKYDHLAKGKEQYHVPWKLMPVGKTDVVEAIISIDKNYKDNKGKPLDPKDVIFVTPQGARFETQFDGKDKYTVSLIPGAEGDIQEIYALYPVNGSSEKFYTLGRLNVISYPAQTHKLTVVQVAGNKINKEALEKKLREVYAPVGVTWEVAFEDFDYKGDVSMFFNDESKPLSAYNNKMKVFQEAYKEHKGGLGSETAYLFILDDSGDGKNRDTQGFMPQGKQFGYIFLKNIKDSKEDVNQIIAHELGHGRWKLSHTFDGTYGGKIVKDDKLNLMSYGGGTHLAKWQWDVMDTPAWFANPLDGDDKGKIVKSNVELLAEFQKDSHYTFFTPDRKCMTIPAKDLKNVYFSTATYLHLIKSDNITDKQIKDYYPLGAFCAFELNSGEYYAAVKNNDGQIKGYYLIKENIVTDKKSNYPIADCNEAICLFLTKNELDENIFGAGVFTKGSGDNCIANFDVRDVTLPIEFGILKSYAKDNIVKPIANLAYTLRSSQEEDQAGRDNRLPFDEEKYSKFLDELSKQLADQYKQGSGIIRDFKFKNEGYEYAITDITDRLTVFDKEVKDTKFIVHFATAPCDIPKDSLDNITERVIARSQLKDKKLVYLLVPGWDKIYWEAGDYFPSTASSVELCVYSVVPETSVPVGQQNSKNIITDIINIYRQVPKPYYLLKHFITGSEFGVYTTYTQTEKSGTITGKDHIYDYALIVDSRIWGLDALESKKLWEQIGAAFAESDAIYGYTPNPLKDEEYYARQKAMQEEIDSYYSIHPLNYQRVSHGLRESCLMGTGGTISAVPLWHTEWYLSSLNDSLFVRMYKNDLRGEHFISGRNEAMGEDILTTLDGVGLALSPWGADIVTDVIGIAVAGYYKKPGQAALYAGSAIIPFASAGAVKFTLKGVDEIKGIAKGTHYVEEAADGTYIVVKKEAKAADGIVDIARDVTKATEKQLDDVFERLIKEPPFEYTPNTIEHKSQRWAQYKESGGDWNYERWSNTYNANMEKARLANKKVSAYYDEINFNCTSGNCKEVTLDVIVNGQARKRRLDIADGNPKVLHGVEVKAYETGKVYATKDILEEIAADAQLIKNRNWKIDWVFVDCDISQPLQEALEAANINIIFKKM